MTEIFDANTSCPCPSVNTRRGGRPVRMGGLSFWSEILTTTVALLEGGGTPLSVAVIVSAN